MMNISKGLTFAAFSKAAQDAIMEIREDDEVQLIKQALNTKGRQFDLFADGDFDSLDLLDLTFCISKTLGIRQPAEFKDSTMGALYDAYCRQSELVET